MDIRELERVNLNDVLEIHLYIKSAIFELDLLQVILMI